MGQITDGEALARGLNAASIAVDEWGRIVFRHAHRWWLEEHDLPDNPPLASSGPGFGGGG